jgi:hypothetical protein
VETPRRERLRREQAPQPPRRDRPHRVVIRDPFVESRRRERERRGALAALALAATASCERPLGEAEVPPPLEALDRVAVLPAGVFLSGTETAPRQEYLDRPFVLDRFETTVEEYAAFLRATGYRGDGPGFLKDWVGGSPPPGYEGRPVAHVSLADAEAYAAWRGMRLPTELEWERAARGASGSKYPWGPFWDRPEKEIRANTIELGLFEPFPAGAFESGRSASHCYDLAGNVLEWTSDPAGVVKGGSFRLGAQDASAARRLRPGSTVRWADLGFRCAADAVPYLRVWLERVPTGGARLRSFLERISARWGPGAVGALGEVAASGGVAGTLAAELLPYAAREKSPD